MDAGEVGIGNWVFGIRFNFKLVVQLSTCFKKYCTSNSWSPNSESLIPNSRDTTTHSKPLPALALYSQKPLLLLFQIHQAQHTYC